MDLIALLPPPLITLAVQLVKKLGLPDGAAPWVALALAIISTVVMNVMGVAEGVVLNIVVFLTGWLGSMGTWEGLKNIIVEPFWRKPAAPPAA